MRHQDLQLAEVSRHLHHAASDGYPRSITAICSRGHEPSAAEASPNAAKQMCCCIIFLMARKALHPSEAAEPSPPSGNTAPGFCHWPRTLLRDRTPPANSRGASSRSLRTAVCAVSLLTAGSRQPPGSAPHLGRCRGDRSCALAAFLRKRRLLLCLFRKKSRKDRLI